MSSRSRQRSVTSYSNKGNSIPGFDPSIYTTKNLPSDDVIKLKECFDIFDYSKNGTVSAEELATAITALGLENEAGKILQIVNSQSGETEMDFEAFLKIFGFQGESQGESNLQSLFEIFDKNGVGSFGVEEFAQICESVGERFTKEQIEQMIEYADKDRDGRISFEQFVEVVTKEYPPV